MENRNELCLAGEITEITYSNKNVCKFILKTKSFEMHCVALINRGIPLNDITVSKKCFVQGTFELKRWTNKNNAEILENQFTVTSLV